MSRKVESIVEFNSEDLEIFKALAFNKSESFYLTVELASLGVNILWEQPYSVEGSIIYTVNAKNEILTISWIRILKANSYHFTYQL